VGEGQGEGVFPFVIGIPLKKKFHLKDVPHFIECVDISNISGRAACGATVCFVDGAPMKARYRLYNIRREERPNDYAMMYEVLYRRFSRTEWGLPDLLLVDGGRGQLSTAMAVLKELNVSVPVVAVGKVGGSHRKGTDVAQIFLPGRVNPLKFKKGDPALLYLIRIRDEAHRFAIKQHRKRAKGVIVSPKDRHSGERRNPVFPAGSRPRLSPG
jgi:excinuclease ABC subunit C